MLGIEPRSLGKAVNALNTEHSSRHKYNLQIPMKQMPGSTQQPPGFVIIAVCPENEQMDSAALYSFQMIASGSVTGRNK